MEVDFFRNPDFGVWNFFLYLCIFGEFGPPRIFWFLSGGFYGLSGGKEAPLGTCAPVHPVSLSGRTPARRCTERARKSSRGLARSRGVLKTVFHVSENPTLGFGLFLYLCIFGEFGPPRIFWFLSGGFYGLSGGK